MFTELILTHRHGNQAPLLAPGLIDQFQAGAVRGHVFSFKTCLRQFAILDAEAAALIGSSAADSVVGANDEVYRGTEAYRFVLQIICGLHSPLIGETEVSGQFKLAVAAYAVPATPWGQQLKRFFQNLFEDAKKIRQTHLVDLGSQSYGSVLRRELKSLRPSNRARKIHILGAGHLVQEILPWIAKDGFDVHVHCRNPLKARAELSQSAKFEIHALNDAGSASGHPEFSRDDVFVIAAPVSAAWIGSWIGSSHGHAPEVIADLRADSAEDRIELARRVIDLTHVFSHINDTQAHLQSRKAAALKAIDAAVNERKSYVEYRPFGWEDVCA